MDHFLTEWDEEVEKDTKFFFGDKVTTPNGDEGQITELDERGEYRVFVGSESQWYTAEELTKI